MAAHLIPRAVKGDASEGDVEAQVVLPLLTASEYLAIPQAHIKSKEYFAPTTLGKGAGKRIGYYPDFGAYFDALPVCIVEAKAPDETADKGYQEAQQYAHDINTRFPTKIDPCAIIIATNGIDLLAGYWDAQPAIRAKVEDIVVGSAIHKQLIDLASATTLAKIAADSATSLNTSPFRPATHRNGGQAMIVSKIEPNSFASDLSPILTRYFSSHNDTTDPEIYDRSYISTTEVTSYDAALESFLKDRATRSQTPIVTTKKGEKDLSKELTRLGNERPLNGALQLITGGVGAGKSLFARRYKEKLQPAELSARSHWAFIDFNTAPAGLNNREAWISEAFVNSLVKEGIPLDLHNGDDQERIFATNINGRRAFYDRVEESTPGRGGLELARDIEKWRLEPETLAESLARHLQGDRRENVIVVFDNVDKLEAAEQLAIFQTALWFMNRTRAFVLVQMRDVTFEAFKNQPPLDTYRSGLVFHISPPKFIDVARRRLELSIEVLGEKAPETVKYTSSNGAIVVYPKTLAGDFLRAIYEEVFASARNVARVIEALSGRDVREALNMFMAVLTSGHMPENLIAATAMNLPDAGLTEARIIRILMRTDYRFFDGKSGFIKNIFYCDPKWHRPTNFLVLEVLYLLLLRSRTVGDNGQMGFVTVSRIQDELEKMGYPREDVFSACEYTQANRLVEADTLSLIKLAPEDCVKTSASGWAHMRLLSERTEYLSGVLPVTAVSDDDFRNEIFRQMELEVRHSNVLQNQRVSIADYFLTYLRDQHQKLSAHPGYVQNSDSGAAYVLTKMERAIKFSRSPTQRLPPFVDPLDF